MQRRIKGRHLNHRNVVSVLLIIFVIPATILFGIFYLKDRKYYFISLVIVLYTMLPFFMIFENRNPKVREIVIIAVLSAIAVAGRAAFFMLPQFKPVVAIVIITGVTLGAESGFLVGAITGFVSNFFFGQGPWTPWQMFCFGIIGFLAGILFQKGLLKRDRLSLCIFGGLSTFFIYGGIINIGSLLIFTPKFSLRALVATYISGFWFDLAHSIATVVFLFVLSQPMIEKIDRVKIKYGIMDKEK
ncbi:ECF transporter S component [Tepidimicrobium xylanilyticum]|uniref:Energy-coupling factor transport system substrate-specific component n=1 Tax=Tepidimicrobium xylanilyticum TaxID=1123352 RepID=A0A1H2WNF3_9FIRM|nr:ECF transporter S component [Tepidimicrobium xylanilyticum]SDW82038.1 energy-coupling factor transport system substrate-specific component [Tepidimicrobium xylanilyticum]